MGNAWSSPIDRAGQGDATARATAGGTTDATDATDATTDAITGAAPGRAATGVRALLVVPGVAGQAATGLLAQLTQQVAPVGAVLLVRESTGSLALAGLVAAAFSIGVGTARPVQGHAIDARGARPVLLATAMLHVAGITGLVAATATGLPGWVLVAFGALAGLGLPPVSASMRLAWGRHVPPGARTAAYSLVMLVQELAILIGPLLLGLLVWVASVRSAMLAVAGLAAAGTAGYAWSLRNRGHAHAPGDRPRRSAAVLRVPGMPVLLAVVVAVGAVTGALQVGVPALATAAGHRAATGPLVAALSAGGILGAVGYGSRRWSAPPVRRLTLLLAGLAATLAPLVVVRALPAVGVTLLAAGVLLNPAVTTATLVLDELVPVSAAAFGWVSTAIGAGASAGAAVAGILGDHAPGRPFVLAVLLAAAAVPLASTGRHRGRDAGAAAGRRRRLRGRTGRR